MKHYWKNRERRIISNEKLKEVILDIEALKSGNYDIVEAEEE